MAGFRQRLAPANVLVLFDTPFQRNGLRGAGRPIVKWACCLWPIFGVCLRQGVNCKRDPNAGCGRNFGRDGLREDHVNDCLLRGAGGGANESDAVAEAF